MLSRYSGGEGAMIAFVLRGLRRVAAFLRPGRAQRAEAEELIAQLHEVARSRPAQGFVGTEDYDPGEDR